MEENITGNEEVLETNADLSEQPNPEQEQPKTAEKKFTQAELEEILKERLARKDKERETAIKEVEKLAKMNKDQKTAYELEQANKRIAEYEEREALQTMRTEARNMLKDEGIQASDEILNFIVSTKADDTQANVKAYAKAFNDAVSEQVRTRLQQDSPDQFVRPSMSRQEIMDIKDDIQRQQAILNNIKLFDK